MSTIICSSCGTRNAAGQEECRRCEAVLGGATPSTGADVPSVFGERWQVEQPLAGTDNPYLFQGRDLKTDEPVLIKRLSRAAARDRSLRSKFIKEAEILDRLDHPHLVDLVEVIDDVDTPAIILSGPGQMTLAELLARRERLPMGIAMEFVVQLLGTLEYLHGKRVTHRQLMPTKILVGPDATKGFPTLSIVDFGLAHMAKVLTLDELEYGPGTLVGMKATDTVSGGAPPRPYLAPEQLRGESHEQSDIYSLGVMFFEMVTGDLPLSSSPTNSARTEESIRSEEPTSVRLLRPEVSADLEDVIMTMLSKDSERRFQNVGAVRNALVMTPEAKSEAMVAIAKGSFLRGSAPDDEGARPEEQPQREVFVDAFYIDRTPVTVADYKAFLDATGRKPLDEWFQFNDVSATPNQPVVFVNWQDASDYARWAGKRLPTEAEWEKAARGTDARTYPWGDEPPTPKRAVFDQEVPGDVGSRPFGTSPWGVHEMAGNVFEWVADWYGRGYYAEAPERNPTGPEDGKKKVIRGGSFAHDDFALRCATRGRYAPDARRANHGFRCAWSLQ
jgi:formylglycine-generating enzyme required for sulfatase activity